MKSSRRRRGQGAAVPAQRPNERVLALVQFTRPGIRGLGRNGTENRFKGFGGGPDKRSIFQTVNFVPLERSAEAKSGQITGVLNQSSVSIRIHEFLGLKPATRST